MVGEFMKVKRWDAAEWVTLGQALPMLWCAVTYPHADRRLRMVRITIRAIIRAAMLKVGLAKPYEWEEFDRGDLR